MVDREELDVIAKLAMKEIPGYIQSIVVRKNDDKPNFATCTFIEVRDKVFAVSCAHVVKNASHVWAGLPILAQPRITDEVIKKVQPRKSLQSMIL